MLRSSGAGSVDVSCGFVTEAPLLAGFDQTPDRTGQDPAPGGPLSSISQNEDKLIDQITVSPAKRPVWIAFLRAHEE